jgi:hypothetical protein
MSLVDLLVVSCWIHCMFMWRTAFGSCAFFLADLLVGVGASGAKAQLCRWGSYRSAEALRHTKIEAVPLKTKAATGTRETKVPHFVRDDNRGVPG